MDKLLPIYLSVVVAAFVAAIGLLQYLTARKQWRTAHNRAVLDQFERRYQIYKELREVVGSIVGSGRATQENFVKVAEAAERSKFLFGDDVVAYIDQFVRDVLELSSLVSEFEGTQGSERDANLKAQRRLKDSIEKFRTDGTTLFARYIRFADKVAA
jgi:hypothetical protein